MISHNDCICDNYVLAAQRCVLFFVFFWKNAEFTIKFFWINAQNIVFLLWKNAKDNVKKENINIY